MMLATFWTLLATDIKIAAGIDTSADFAFTVITTICFFLFAIEVMLSLYAKDRYYKSLYFAFDLCATLTLITEMTWLMTLLQGDAEAQKAAASDGGGAVDAARTARTVRLLRVVRLVRLVRLVKIYRYVMDYLSRDVEVSEKQITSGNASWEDNPSAVGRALQESITLQVIMGVLIMLVVFPYLSVAEVRIRLDYENEIVRQLDE
eukprot:CAMPEP_0119430640 /NCGR_PEP_ID=MMETSP1335-20130426/44493_1 /TAXON_ID=259385 /ORGANISM="Chrysoculter rhomboideus, Strain RCC1486" /LENGTH=204 /DNA_ID=CAMNT_0007456401 /DNA_START=18 /DNA_END=629 /DNA_ORIENTATION=+